MAGGGMTAISLSGCMTEGRVENSLKERNVNQPNIILILADDLGIPGVGCYGGIYKTPRLDAMAREGVRFEYCFSAPLCAPSRAMLMTGRFPFRTGVVDNGIGDKATPKTETIIAKILKQAGYVTAMAGKWHQLPLMNSAEEAKAWGFDEFLKWDKFTGERYWKPGLNRNGQPVPVTEKSYAPDILHEYVVDFIARHKDRPFFLYYPMTLIHAKLFKTPDSGVGGGDLLADNIAYMDKLVGKLLDELEKLKLAEKTLVVFVGDNGLARYGGKISGREIAGHKGTVLEGGSRVPMVVSWKGTTTGGKVSKDLVEFTDFYATFAEVAGAKLPEGLKIDSCSFVPQIKGEAGKPREWIFIQLGNKWYVRDARWKLNQSDELFDMKDAPFAEHLVAAGDQNGDAAGARAKLQKVLDDFGPALQASSVLEKKVKKKVKKSDKKAKGQSKKRKKTGTLK